MCFNELLCSPLYNDYFQVGMAYFKSPATPLKCPLSCTKNGHTHLCDHLRFLTVLHRQDSTDSNSGPFKLSKWELMDKETKLGKWV